jgi:hypothetical protein
MVGMTLAESETLFRREGFGRGRARDGPVIRARVVRR